MKPIFLAFALTLAPSFANAATFTVSGQSNGGYGATNIFEPFFPLTMGPDLLAEQQIQITASGFVDPGPGSEIGPAGQPFEFTGSAQSPLLEAAGLSGVVDPHSVALLGYFVSKSLLPVSAWDSERDGDLPASGLFLIGESASFSAPEDGTLFFGVNDPRVSNNSGAFLVEVSQATEVPLPAGAWLLLSGLVLLGLRRRY